MLARLRKGWSAVNRCGAVLSLNKPYLLGLDYGVASGAFNRLLTVGLYGAQGRRCRLCPHSIAAQAVLAASAARSTPLVRITNLGRRSALLELVSRGGRPIVQTRGPAAKAALRT